MGIQYHTRPWISASEPATYIAGYAVAVASLVAGVLLWRIQPGLASPSKPAEHC